MWRNSTKALLSNLYLKDLFNPYVKGPRSNIERHHLFPKNYLKGIGLTSTRDTNQIANYAWIEWSDNGTISDEAPEKYFLKYLPKMSASERTQMFYWHALPENWWTMNYDDFLKARRKLIAKVIRDGFEKITDELSSKDEKDALQNGHLK